MATVRTGGDKKLSQPQGNSSCWAPPERRESCCPGGTGLAPRPGSRRSAAQSGKWRLCSAALPRETRSRPVRHTGIDMLLAHCTRPLMGSRVRPPGFLCGFLQLHVNLQLSQVFFVKVPSAGMHRTDWDRPNGPQAPGSPAGAKRCVRIRGTERVRGPSAPAGGLGWPEGTD